MEKHNVVLGLQYILRYMCFFTLLVSFLVSKLWELGLEKKLEPNCRGVLLLVFYLANNFWSLKVLELGSDMFTLVISLYQQSATVGWIFFSLLNELFERWNFQCKLQNYQTFFFQRNEPSCGLPEALIASLRSAY